MIIILCYKCCKEEQEHFFDSRRCELYGDKDRTYKSVKWYGPEGE